MEGKWKFQVCPTSHSPEVTHPPSKEAGACGSQRELYFTGLQDWRLGGQQTARMLETQNW